MGVRSGPQEGDSGTHSPGFRRRNVTSAGWKERRRKLINLRERLYRQRLSLKERRNEIKEERMEVDELEGKLLTSISRSLDTGAELDGVLVRNLHADIIAKKDELGALQYDYDQAEEDYDQAEADFDAQEGDGDDDLNASTVEMVTQSSDGSGVSQPRAIPDVEISIVHSPDPNEASQTLVPEDIYQSRSLSPKKPDQFNDTISALGHIQEATTRKNSIKSDSEHDMLEATFFIRAQSTVTQEGDRYESSGLGISTPARARIEPRTQHEHLYWERATHQGFIHDTDVEPSKGRFLNSRFRPHSDSGVVTHRRGLIRRRSRMTWWLFDTFGSSGVDYTERTRDKGEFHGPKDMDDETWARLWARIVYGHWTHKATPPTIVTTRGEYYLTEDTRKTSQVEFHALGGSYLLLPSGLSEIKHRLNDVDRLFPLSQAPAFEPTESRKVEETFLPSRRPSSLP